MSTHAWATRRTKSVGADVVKAGEVRPGRNSVLKCFFFEFGLAIGQIKCRFGGMNFCESRGYRHGSPVGRSAARATPRKVCILWSDSELERGRVIGLPDTQGEIAQLPLLLRLEMQEARELVHGAHPWPQSRNPLGEVETHSEVGTHSESGQAERSKPTRRWKFPF